MVSFSVKMCYKGGGAGLLLCGGVWCYVQQHKTGTCLCLCLTFLANMSSLFSNNVSFSIPPNEVTAQEINPRGCAPRANAFVQCGAKLPSTELEETCVVCNHAPFGE